MGVPQILAINDVHLAAEPKLADRVMAFYGERLGLIPIESAPEREAILQDIHRQTEDGRKATDADRWREAGVPDGGNTVDSAGERVAVFRGARRSGPRLVIRFGKPSARLRGQILVQVDSLSGLADELSEHGEVATWIRGWSFYDRRLVMSDPAGNWLHLVTSHRF